MSYNSSTKTITAPVSIYDVQQALNTTEKDLGKLCRHDNINMWAKYKPVRVATPLPIDDEARKVVRWGITPDYLPTGQMYFNKLIASNAKYLTIPNPTLGEEQLNNLQPYTYSFPRGDRTNIREDGGSYGVKEWYRLSDFAGYKHDAVVPFHTCIQNVLKINQDANNWLIINPLRTHNISFVAYKDVNSEFSLEEILRVENLSSYFMVVEFYSGEGDAWKTAESPNYYYEFPLIASGSGQYFSGAVGTVDVTEMVGNYHVCIGLKQKDIANDTWVDKSGILSPREWDPNTIFRGFFPYYYRLKFEPSQAEEEFNPISRLGFGVSSWFTQGESATIWKTDANITNQQIFVEITMKNDRDKDLYFAGNNISVIGTKMMLGIQNTTPGMDGGNIVSLIPSNENRQTGGSLNTVTVPANTEKVLYATGYALPNKQSSNTEYYKLQLYCKIGNSDWYPITAINLEYI